MASINKEPNGRRTIQFVAGDGKRRSIRLGKATQRDAELVKTRVEALAAAALAGNSLDAQTAGWVGKLDSTMHKKLAAVGLVAPRAAKESAKLAAFLDSYV